MSGEASSRCLRRLNEIRERERDRWRTHDSLARRNCVVRIPPITNWQVYFSSLSERRRERERERGKVSRAAITIDKLPNDLPPSFSLIPVRRTNFSPVEKLYPTDTARKLCLRFLWEILRARVLYLKPQHDPDATLIRGIESQLKYHASIVSRINWIDSSGVGRKM